jgi:hypothetical protein
LLVWQASTGSEWKIIAGSDQTIIFSKTSILFNLLNRRSQRLSYNWTGYKDLLKQFSKPAPKITEKYPGKQLKLFAY